MQEPDIVRQEEHIELVEEVEEKELEYGDQIDEIL